MAAPENEPCFVALPEADQLWWIYNTLSNASGGGGGLAIVSNPETVTRFIATTNGAIPAGVRRTTVLSSSDFTGTLAGANFLPNLAETFAPQLSDTLNSIPYTITTGSLTITTLT